MSISKTTSNTNDVAMDSSHATYTNARSGSGAAITGSSTATTTAAAVGQNNAGNYHCYESFFSWAYPAVPSDKLLVSSYFNVRYSGITGSVLRDHEFRDFDFGASPDVPGDFRGGDALKAMTVLGVVGSVNAGFSPYYPYVAGSTALHNKIAANGAMRVVLDSSRQVAGNKPGGAEYAGIVFANYATDAYRPKLVYSTLTNSLLARVGGASCQLSTGATVYVTYDGTNLNVRWANGTGTETDIDTISVSSNVHDADMSTAGWQTVSICADIEDNFYIVHKAGNEANSVVVRVFENTGTNTWTAKPPRQVAMPAYTNNPDVPINNIAVTWHSTVNWGHLMILGSHRQGSGDHNQIFWATVSCLNANVGTTPYVIDSGADPYWLGLQTPDAPGTRPTNDLGNCLDVYGDGTASGYAMTADSTMTTGTNITQGKVAIGRYTLNSNGTLKSGVKYDNRTVSGKELDPETKAKIVPIDAGRIAFCYGGEIRVYATSGSYVGGGDFTSTGSTFTPWTTSAVDYFYDKAAGKIWMYYIDQAATRTLLRRGFSTSSYGWDTTDVTLSTNIGPSGSSNLALRIPRGRVNERQVRVDIANLNVGTHAMTTFWDSLNVPPDTPSIKTRSNFNANNPATFSWKFSDANTADRQSAFQLRIYDTADNSLDYDTGKLYSTVNSHTVPATTLLNSKAYYWQVQVWDQSDAVSAWSQQGTFQTLSTAITTITSPSADNPADATGSTYQITWSTTVITQAKYHLVFTDTQANRVLLDTGWVTSSATSYLLSGLQNGVTYRVEVTTRDSVDVESSTGTRLITPAYVEPSQPDVTLVPIEAGVSVVVTNPYGSTDLGPPNNEFDSNVTGWFSTGGTLVYSTAQYMTSPGSALLTTTGTPTQTYARPNNSTAMPVEPRREYIIEISWYSPAGYTDTRVAIDWLDENKSYISTSSDKKAAPAGAWDTVSYTYTAPDNARFAVCGPTMSNNPPTGTQLYIDSVKLHTGDIPLASSNEIWRSETGKDEFTKIATIGPNSTYNDYTVQSGKSYDYYVVAVL